MALKKESKLEKIITLIFLIFLSNCSIAETYIFKEYSSDFKKVIFSNGDILEIVRKNKDQIFGEKLNYTRRAKGYKNISLEDDVISFSYAYPSKDKAIFTVLQSSCSGSACAPSISIIYIHNNEIYMDDVGTAFYNDGLIFDVNIVNREIILKIINVNTFEKNNFGDYIKYNLKLINGIGLADDKFSDKYLKFIGAHPDAFFSDVKFREKLARQIGLEKFRLLRENMEVASPSKLISGHYIMMHGCKAHYCDSNSGLILIDTKNDNYYSLIIDKAQNKIERNTSLDWSPKIINLILESLGKNNFQIEFIKNNFIFSY
jgi:hypothetical protein